MDFEAPFEIIFPGEKPVKYRAATDRARVEGGSLLLMRENYRVAYSPAAWEKILKLR